jgi:hypothetical protein
MIDNLESIEERIKNRTDENIINVKNSPGKAIMLIVAGIALVIISIIGINNESVRIGIVLTGIVLAIVGIGYWFSNTENYVYEPTGKKLTKHKIFLSPYDAKKMISDINMKNFSNLKEIKKVVDSGYWIDIRITDDGSICLLQIMEYIPHEFVPSSPVVILHDDDAKAILNWVKS